jgi:predicted alpha/beta-hydrolase family hydrolase
LTYIRFKATSRSGETSALIVRPEAAKWLLVLGHGAGAGIKHPFIEAIAGALADHRVATFRYNFPYMEQTRKRPDPPAVLTATVRSAITAAATEVPDLPLLAGGKSMGGRMTSLAASKTPLPEVAGLVFFGFPLHPIAKPGTERAEHLTRVAVPMLLLQGTRDRLADLGLIHEACTPLGELATLHVVDGADHSFHVLKRSGRSDDDVVDELAHAVANWALALDVS